MTAEADWALAARPGAREAVAEAAALPGRPNPGVERTAEGLDSHALIAKTANDMAAAIVDSAPPGQRRWEAIAHALPMTTAQARNLNSHHTDPR
jgi:hypothetical protein